MRIIISKDGPYIVEGRIPLNRLDVKGKNKIPYEYTEVEKFENKNQYALCRCGLSKKKPFCDGSHKDRFNGALTYKDEDYYQNARTVEGKDFILYDNKSLCSGARFCMSDETTWILISSSDTQKRDIAVRQVHNCPSGRLVLRSKDGELMEPKLEPSISLLEDSLLKVSGPVWVKGGIPVEYEEGKTYKIRNRVTLCRCGQSKNKPLCDRSHFYIKFKDEGYFKA